ncbi:MAG: EthD family reductase [Actinomycetota bacterium]|nr:EthD family reductase [Actinomycetota bacterium]
MLKVSVLYPSSDGSTFDMDYYQQKHKPLVLEVLGCERFEIDKGVDGPYMAVGHLFFESMEKMQAGMAGPRAGEAMADVANFTNVQPAMQVSEIVE